MKVKVLVTEWSPALCNSMDYSPPGSSVHEISQARILEWVVIPSPGYLPDPDIEPMSPTLHILYPLSHQGNPSFIYSSGAWWAAIYGVTQSRRRLKRLSSSGVYMSIPISLLSLCSFLLPRFLPSLPPSFSSLLLSLPPLLVPFLFRPQPSWF